MSNDGTSLDLHSSSLKDEVQHISYRARSQSPTDQLSVPETSNVTQPTYSQALLSSNTQAFVYNSTLDLTSQSSPNTGYPKPPVGSEEWHRVRRENHKEVERRRRETINSGINELAKIVPGCEKNKGSILSRTAQYIHQLKENEAVNIEKWTLEKLLTDQAINELSAQVEMLKAENQQLHAHLEELNPNEKRPRKE